MDILGIHLGGHKPEDVQKPDPETAAKIADGSADREAEAASEAAFEKIEPINQETSDLKISGAETAGEAPVTAAVTNETPAENNVVELPAPVAESAPEEVVSTGVAAEEQVANENAVELPTQPVEAAPAEQEQVPVDHQLPPAGVA